MHFSMLIKEIVHISPFSWLTKVFFLLLKQFNLYLTTLNPKRLPQLYTARHSALHKFIAVFSAAPAASTHYKYLRAARSAGFHGGCEHLGWCAS